MYPGQPEHAPTLPCSITSGTFGDGKYFQDLVDNVNDMTKGNDWFLVANDFATYMKAQDEVDAVSHGGTAAVTCCMLRQSWKCGEHLMPCSIAAAALLAGFRAWQGSAVACIECMLRQSCECGKEHLMPARLLMQHCLLVSALGKCASAYFGQPCISH